MLAGLAVSLAEVDKKVSGLEFFASLTTDSEPHEV
jgi:hypothetical protein